MAEMIDEIVEEVGEIEAVDKEQEPQKPELPEKYKEKSLEDIVKMHQEAEKLISRQAQEVGEVRKLADELLRSQISKKEEPKVEPEIDFFDDPQAAIRQAVEKNPKVIAAEQYALQAQREQSKNQLAQKHPDFSTIVIDPDFAEYVNSSPVRKQLYAMAENYDFNAADELLTVYKQIKNINKREVVKVDNELIDKSIKSASVDTGGTGESSRKVYRRADLIRLKMNDPNRYDALQDEIMAAYREGRVK